jgi:hypothetical protein
MAKYDPDRIAETAEPYAPGQSGIELLCDEQGRMVLSPASVGGGAGSATEAKQDDQIVQLDDLIAAAADQLAATTGLSTEVTLGLVKTAIETAQASSDGKLDTLHTDLGALATQATAQAIADELVAQGVTLDSMLSDTSASLTALGTLATGADVADVETACLADDADIATIATLIASQATAAKQDALKAVADTMAASLAAIESDADAIRQQTDDLETIAAATRDRLPAALVGGRLPVVTTSAATELSPAYVRLPQDGFGRTVVVEPTPALQLSFSNGVTPDLCESYTTDTATVTSTAASDAFATVSTGATSTSIGELVSIDRAAYRAGQAMRALISTRFSAPAVGGFQVVGVGPNDGFGVGHNELAFGFLWRYGGVREIRTLTVTVGSLTAENITITLNSIATLVAVTNSGSTITTAREIAAGNYSTNGPGWDAYQLGATVIFVARRNGSRAGTYSLSLALTAVGTFAQTVAGVASTDTWVAKTAWNGDRIDGATGVNNASGATLDPTKINIWQILIPYLGGGNIVLQWYDPTTGQWSTCHTIRSANTITTATPIGPKVNVPPTFKTTVGNASELPLFSARVEPHYNGAENRWPVRFLQLTVSGGATGQLMLRFYLNGVLSGPTNFQFTDILNRPLTYDTGATGITNGLPVGCIITSPSGGSTTIPLLDLIYALAPGDVVTVTAQQTSGSNGTVAAALTGALDCGSGNT